MIWYLEESGLSNGQYNMAYDERLARTLPAERGVVRLYGWSPYAVSLGWNQREDDVVRERCTSAGIDVVRRPTGGRAILHAQELTYCVAMPATRMNVLSTYNEISRALVAGLRFLGVQAELEKAQPHFPSLYRTPASVACFTSSGRYEVHVRSRKLVGSAQRRLMNSAGQETVLQHGSILIGPEHKRIIDFLRVTDEEERWCVRDELNKRTTELSTELGRTPALEEVVECIRRGFEETWGIRFVQPAEVFGG